MIKAGIFDIGNVLLRWTNLPLFEDVDQTLEITEEQRQEHWEKFMDQLEVGKITETRFWQEFITATKAPGKLPKESLLQRKFKEKFTLDEEVVRIPERLKEFGFKLGVISNTIAPHAEVMHKSALFDGFDVITLSNEVGYRKPEKEIYELTVEKLGVAPKEAFFVDDLPINVEGAEKVGIKGILFQNHEQLVKDISALGVEL